MKPFRKLKEKEGWVTIMTVVILSVIMPIFLFFYVELNHYYKEKDKLDYVTQNMASSAVRQIDEQALKQLILRINEQEAKNVAKEIMKHNYNLDDSLSPTSNSPLLEAPTIEVYVLNQAGQSITIDGKKIQADSPAVVVATSAKPTNIFFNRFVNLRSISVYEVEPSEETAEALMIVDTLINRLRNNWNSTEGERLLSRLKDLNEEFFQIIVCRTIKVCVSSSKNIGIDINELQFQPQQGGNL